MGRQIVMDTETTGLDPKEGHRIIEIGCVELEDRRLTGNNFHEYLQPDRAIDPRAMEIHGITNEFLIDKPRFLDVQRAFLDYIDGAELIIHNAGFDVSFIDHELQLNNYSKALSDHCSVIDSLKLAREMYPGQRNSLDALCKRLDINNGHRTLHGALLDSEILADVYLRMTGGQTDLALEASTGSESGEVSFIPISSEPGELKVIFASAEELEAHQEWMKRLEDQSEDGPRCPTF